MKVIENEEQYETALAKAYSLMQLNLLPESKESDELEVLSVLIKEYEQEHYSVKSKNCTV